jgi:hypothetical protein
LGCSIGFGLLHRIPKTTTATTAPSFLLPTGKGSSSGKLEIDDDEDQKLLKQMGKIISAFDPRARGISYLSFCYHPFPLSSDDTEFNQVTENATASKDTPVNFNRRSHSLEAVIREEEEI